MKEERAYLKTHPWIKFQFDTRRLDYQTWLLLGEAKSKCEHLIGIPLLPEIREWLYQVYLAKGALGTTAIEGNTLTEQEVIQRIDGQLELPPSKEYLGKEIDNILQAVNMIGRNVLTIGEDKISIKEIKLYNSLVLKDLPLAEYVVPGEIRKYKVGVARYQGAPPEDCEYLLDQYIGWLNDEFHIPENQELAFGIFKAILAQLFFMWIHPFGDGNGRTARLLEFRILLSVGVPAVAAHLLSSHYNATRNEYYRQLELSSKSENNIEAFIKYSLQGFIDGLRQEIELIKTQQLYVHFINHVHGIFKDKNREENNRRKRLILEWIEKNPESINKSEVRLLTPKVAEMYAGLSDKTVERDIQKLVDLELLTKSNKKFQINWPLLQAYLAPVRPKKSQS